MKPINDISKENIAAIYKDDQSNEQYIFTRDQLINHLQSICPKIEQSFDEIFSEDFKSLSSVLSEISALLFIGRSNAQKDQNLLLITCGGLLLNSFNTITASTQILRCGFRLQSGILLRSVIEMCATIFHLITKSDDLQKFLNDKLSSTKLISKANKQIPLFGRLWGLMSKEQIHINTKHADLYPMGIYNDKDEIPASVTLGIIGASTVILYIVTELAYIDNIETPRYWEIIGDGRFKLIPPKASSFSWIEKLLDKK